MPNPYDISITNGGTTFQTPNSPVFYDPSKETVDAFGDRLLSGEGGTPEGDTIRKWADENGYKITDDSLDYIYNQFFTEKNNATAWERTMEADRSQYQRAVADLKAAGLNPVQLLGGFGGNSPSAPAGSIGSGSLSSSLASKRGNKTDLLTQIISTLGLLGGAALMTLFKK